MKKIFALLVVIGMLAVAGAAFAAEQGVPGGHVTPEPVTPNAPEVPTEVEVPQSGVEDTVTVIKETVETVDAVVPSNQNVVTETKVEDLQKTASASANEAIAAVSDTAKKEVYEAQIASLDAKITELKAKVDFLESVAKLVVTAITGSEPVKAIEASTITMTAATGTKTEQISSAAQKLAQLAANTEDTTKAAALKKQTPVAVMPTMKPATSGVAVLPMPQFAKETYGMKVKYNNFKTGSKAGKGVKVAAADDEAGEAVFLNSLGEEVTTVPGESGDAIPGYLNVATYMEEGETYEPVISVANDDKGESGTALTTTTEKVDVTVVTEETIDFVTASWAASGVTNKVDGTVIAALANLDSGSFDAKVLDAKYISADGWKVDDDEEDAWETSSYELQPVALIFPIKGASEDGTYVLRLASFDLGDLDYEKISKDLDKNFHFYTDGAEAGKEISADVWTSISGDLVEVFPKDLFDDTEAKGRVKTGAVKSEIKSGYVTFAIKTTSKYTKPLLAIKVNVSSNGGTSPPHHSGGGGGCSAGFSGLALVALGGLALLRKKK